MPKLQEKLWKREFFWKDIPKQRFTAFRLRNARSYAGETPKVQTGAEQNGSRWRYWRIRFCDQLGREGEFSKSIIFLDYPQYTHKPILDPTLEDFQLFNPKK